MSEALTLVELAHEQYRSSMEEHQRKRRSFIRALEYARDEGESYAAIGRRVGLPRQKVFRLIHGE